MEACPSTLALDRTGRRLFVNEGQHVSVIDTELNTLVTRLPLPEYTYAEGLAVLRGANVGKRKHDVDAETTPLRDPEHYAYDLDLRDIAEVWRRGSVIASWLLDLTAAALVDDPALRDFSGRVSDSGEGRWTIKAAIDEAVPVPVLSTALYQRFSSRGEADFQDKLLSALRFQFGGHVEKKSGKQK